MNGRAEAKCKGQGMVERVCVRGAGSATYTHQARLRTTRNISQKCGNGGQTILRSLGPNSGGRSPVTRDYATVYGVNYSVITAND